MRTRIRDWFTTTRRQAIQVAVAALAPLLVYAGIITDGQTEHILTLTQVALQMFAGILALVNLRPTAIADWFATAGRASIYAAAVVVAPAAEALGWINSAQSAQLLTALSLSLTALAALVAVVHAPSIPAEVVRSDLDGAIAYAASLGISVSSATTAAEVYAIIDAQRTK